MEELKKIAESLPLLENVNHLDNLQKAYELGGWVEVDAYIDTITNLAYLRDTKSTNKKNKLITRLLNALK